MVVKSPFKFLNPYSELDSEYYFGREREEKLLFEFIQKNKLVLVYGPSGTGKTSLVKSGLTKRMPFYEWRPIYIRRESNLNVSLRLSLQDELLKNHLDDEEDIAKAINLLASNYLCSVFLIFEQFEEFLLLASKPEVDEFINTLRTLLYSKTPNVSCQIIIVMREEFFALFDKLDVNLPNISDRRLRVDPMEKSDVIKVIRETLNYEKFNISLENEEEQVNLIYNALSDGKDQVSLPYLQVYLDQLWKVDYNREYPNGYTSEGFPPLTLTIKEILEFGNIGDVLQTFLTDQKRSIDIELKARFPHLESDFLNMVLCEFVSDYGTKMPIIYEVSGNNYEFPKTNGRSVFDDFDKDALKYVIDSLNKMMILRIESRTIELSHDILAKLIYGQIEGKHRKAIRIRVLIKHYKDQKDIIPYSIIKDWGNQIDEKRLGEDEFQYYLQSRQIGERKQAERQLKKALEKKESEYKARISSRNKTLFVCFFLIALLLGFFYRRNLKVLDGYYALDVVSGLDSAKDKMAALNAANYVYDFIDDGEKRGRISEWMISYVKRPAYDSANSLAKFHLNTMVGLLYGVDVDISKTGKYIVVKNDSITGIGQSSASNGSQFSVFNYESNIIDTTFHNILYAYFINHSDTLFLAYSDTSSPFLKIYPNQFRLYCCQSKEVVSFSLNRSKTFDNLLYSREEVFSNNQSDWDSYKARRLSSGKLVLPYFDFKSRLASRKFGNPGRIVVGGDGKLEDPMEATLYTISTSKKFDSILYCYYSGERLNFAVSESTGKHFLVFEDAKMADFTYSGNLIFAKENDVYLKSPNETKKVTLAKKISVLYSLFSDDHLLATDVDGNLNLINFNQRNQIFKWDEELIGVDNRNGTFITRNKERTDGIIRSNYLYQRNLHGVMISKKYFEYGIDSYVFNESTNTILLKSSKLKNNFDQLVYLVDRDLNIKGSFYLTPNDTFDFCSDGSKFYIVKDDKLLVFANKRYFDLTDLKSIKSGIVENNYNSSKVKNDFNIKFPTQALGL